MHLITRRKLFCLPKYLRAVSLLRMNLKSCKPTWTLTSSRNPRRLRLKRLTRWPLNLKSWMSRYLSWTAKEGWSSLTSKLKRAPKKNAASELSIKDSNPAIVTRHRSHQQCINKCRVITANQITKMQWRLKTSKLRPQRKSLLSKSNLHLTLQLIWIPHKHKESETLLVQMVKLKLSAVKAQKRKIRLWLHPSFKLSLITKSGVKTKATLLDLVGEWGKEKVNRVSHLKL
jgi:hypothetical protein